MNTYYYDTDVGRDARLWSDIVSPTIAKLQIPVGQREFNPPTQDGVVFIHHSSLACTEAAANELTAKYPSAIFVWIFGGGLRDAPVGERYYSVRAVVRKPNDAAFKRRVASFLADYEKSKTPAFLLLEPEDQAPHLAIRLLCEAWMFTAGEAERPIDGEITIHAPTSLDMWLKPFGQGATVESVCKAMGGTETHVATLFDTIKTSSGKDAVKAAVKTFLGTQRG